MLKESRLHSPTRIVASHLKMKGVSLELDAYEATELRTNRFFQGFQMPEFARFYLPESMRPFTNLSPVATKEFLIDDNRGAVAPSPVLRLDGTDFYLSVKGIGSTTNPFSRRLLGKDEVCSLLGDSNLREKIVRSRETSPRYITAELWQRWSPYGGQGLQHANISMRASEMADLTSIHGFRIAPIVNIVSLPEPLENEIKKLYWYRRFPGRIVQETRLVPSNVRVYFHSGTTVGSSVGSVFDFFEVDSNDKALEFVKNFVKSGFSFLTLFARSMKRNDDGTYSGLDFYDVWLDKDAVLAPDGTIYFVDLEGLEWITLSRNDISEKIHDHFYRSLYEFMYAYEQIERERFARFRVTTERKLMFDQLVREALRDDPVVEVTKDGSSLVLVVSNALEEQSLTEKFPILDW